MVAHGSGHAGGSTVHAGSLRRVPARLESLGALAGMSREELALQAAGAFDDVYFLDRTASGRRLIAHATLAESSNGRLCIVGQ
jgi:pilus assembly protein CpaF